MLCKHCLKDILEGKKVGLYDLMFDGTILYFCPHCKRMIEEGTYWRLLPDEDKRYWIDGGKVEQ